MSVIVTDAGFAPDAWSSGFVGCEAFAADPLLQSAGLDLAAGMSLDELTGLATGFDRIALVRIQFPSFSDGRGFTLARHLRLLDYRGRLRASGPLIADQYAMARRSGFDEVEIDAELALRQPEVQWKYRSNWQSHHYQVRLGAVFAKADEGVRQA